MRPFDATLDPPSIMDAPVLPPPLCPSMWTPPPHLWYQLERGRDLLYHGGSNLRAPRTQQLHLGLLALQMLLQLLLPVPEGRPYVAMMLVKSSKRQQANQK